MRAFDNGQYGQEVRERWGDTAAYREYQSRAPQADAAEGLAAVFAAFAACKAEGHAPDSEVARRSVVALQAYITAHFYTCTDEILAGLGQMYVCDERFAANIDRHGAGTAAFAAAAIAAHTAR